MRCGQTTPPANSFPNYSISGLATKSQPISLIALEKWLVANSPRGRWIGKLYVASTLSWTGTNFSQEACSPNYQAGWWTLTCCKHEMRSAMPINWALNHPARESVFIFTLAEKDAMGQQNLVSVAKVTAHFSDMHAYAKRIIGSADRTLISSRLSRNRRNDGWLGWRFGDCHSDRSGAIGPPHVGHEHGLNRGHCWAADNAPGHTLLMSDCFILWSKPKFSSTHMLKQSRYGQNIDSGNLRQLLK